MGSTTESEPKATKTATGLEVLLVIWAVVFPSPRAPASLPASRAALSAMGEGGGPQRQASDVWQAPRARATEARRRIFMGMKPYLVFPA